MSIKKIRGEKNRQCHKNVTQKKKIAFEEEASCNYDKMIIKINHLKEKKKK